MTAAGEKMAVEHGAGCCKNTQCQCEEWIVDSVDTSVEPCSPVSPGPCLVNREGDVM